MWPRAESSWDEDTRMHSTSSQISSKGTSGLPRRSDSSRQRWSRVSFTWLAALSACDTGSGEARAGEGVLGLRRGFVQAGARNLLITLWQVASLEEGARLTAAFWGMELTLLEADRLSIVFGWIFGITILAWTLYAWHLRRRLEIVSAFLYGGCALGVVFAGDGRAPHGHDRITDELLDQPAVMLDGVPGGLVVARERLAHELRVTPFAVVGE